MPPDEVTAHAPVRAADVGGWTDTWFAGSGLVCSVAVGPAVTVTARRVDGPAGRVELDATTLGERYAFGCGERPGRHPLLEAAVARWAPTDAALAVRVDSVVPPGSGLGTSAAVAVALVGALRALAGAPADAAAVARAAHELETIDLGLQSGVQDQVAAAHGGALRIAIDPYPAVRVARLAVPAPQWRALDERLVTVYLGQPHRSSVLHDQVIASLGDDRGTARLDPLRRAAAEAADALAAGELAAYGAALSAASEGQRVLHPALVSPEADLVWSIARACGALGWKVNGAGGAGGSVTVLAGDPAATVAALGTAGWRVLPLRPTATGLTLT